MKFIKILLLTCVSLLSAQNLPVIAVMELQGRGISADNLAGLTNRLRTELFKSGSFKVIERSQMDIILKEQGFQQSGCISSECAVEVGQLIGAEKIVVGDIDRIDSIYVTDIRLVDVRTGAIERTATTDCDECTMAEVLRNSIFNTAQILAGKKEDGNGTAIPMLTSNPSSTAGNGTGALEIRSNRNNQLIINGDSIGKGRQIVTNLKPGNHRIQIIPPHQYEYQSNVMVHPNTTKIIYTPNIVPFAEFSFLQGVMNFYHNGGKFVTDPRGFSFRTGCMINHHQFSGVFDLGKKDSLDVSLSIIYDWQDISERFLDGRLIGGGFEYGVFPLITKKVTVGIGTTLGYWKYSQSSYFVFSNTNQSAYFPTTSANTGASTYAQTGFYGTVRGGYKYLNLNVNYRFLFNTGMGENMHLISIGAHAPIRKFYEPKGKSHE